MNRKEFKNLIRECIKEVSQELNEEKKMGIFQRLARWISDADKAQDDPKVIKARQEVEDVKSKISQNEKDRIALDKEGLKLLKRLGM